MKKNLKYILTFFSFFLLNIIVHYVLPNVSSSNIIDLILRLTINALFLLTIIYLFHKEILLDFSILKSNIKISLITIFTYLLMLLILLSITSIINFLVTRSSGDSVYIVDYLYRRIPAYLFINYVLLFPLIETIMFRYIINKPIKSATIFIVISSLLYTIYMVVIFSHELMPSILTGIILALCYSKTKNIAYLFIISTIFSLILFLVNYI